MRAALFPIPCIFAFLVGCASHPDKIATAYVSPLKYKDSSCDQIALEIDYVGQKTTQLYQRLKKERTSDNWQMGLGLVLFWPTLFFLEGGDGPEATEYSQLKGDFEALRQTATAKNCSVTGKSPEQIIKEAEDEKRKREAEQKALESKS